MCAQQARSGCSCAGPYGHRLFGYAHANCRETEESVRFTRKGEGAFKLGWARVNFNYFMDAAEADFLRRAVEQVAESGWKLLPFYEQNPASGQYSHRSFNRQDSLRLMSELHFEPGVTRYRTM